MEDSKCRNTQCRCSGDQVDSDGFCSDECRSSSSEGGRCHCTHDGCR